MAETFGFLLSTDEEDELPGAYKSENVRKKANYLVELVCSLFECKPAGE